MILTVTLNAALDRTLTVPSFASGHRHRATDAIALPGGKGVNVARALAANAAPVRAVLPCGGAEGIQLVALLARSGIEVIEVPIDGAVRPTTPDNAPNLAV